MNSPQRVWNIRLQVSPHMSENVQSCEGVFDFWRIFHGAKFINKIIKACIIHMITSQMIMVQ